VTKKVKKAQAAISSLLAVNPVLPGESAEVYQDGLAGLIVELEAKTVLQVYLAEKIYECLWWIRRYDTQKRERLLSEMAQLLEGDTFRSGPSQAELVIRRQLGSPALSPTILEMLGSKHYDLALLRQEAHSSCASELRALDDQIALQVKILAGLQASYEVAANRKLNIERLRLQNALLARDLEAIEGTVSPD
jgi:hypothetical protein